jgi:cytochrome bd-type quinol oxidase subunit 2|tara:strand:+ start:2313 stop:2744 length:432 start_codon:yes stop_codon:yes gene_type:complete
MDDPLRTVVAGLIGGALMGMSFMTHMALLLVYHPPEVLKKRAVESTVSSLITVASVITFVSWNLLAIAMAFAALATQSSDQPQVSVAPSPVYLFIAMFLTVFIAIPAFIFFRDRKQHLIGELLIFLVIFGLLIPNLVVVVHRT